MKKEAITGNLAVLWQQRAVLDPDLIPELRSMDAATEFDAFWRDLEFGTAGLRGIIGAGTNRMNVYTVARASQGLADYINSLPQRSKSIAVSRDSRIKSDLFARTAAAVFAANGIHVYIYRDIMPVPCLSFAVRYLGCSAGVMVTASHNPSVYNGYKVYGPDGCQMTEESSAAVSEAIARHDIFDGVNRGDFDALVAEGRIDYISDGVYTAFTEAVKACSVLGPGDAADRNVAIVYTPLHGSGLRPVMRVLTESGYTNITVVKEQEEPDGNFTTCPYPNPEIREALDLGLGYAERLGADLLLATDPDCDRVGIAVRKKSGEYALLSGNQTGMLLLDYLCSRRAAAGKLPPDAMFVKTIVTAGLCNKIGASYGVRCKDVLTGFKYIGEQITALTEKGRGEAYVLGFEESYGYLSGTHVRDKDGVNAAFLICEMFSYYKAQGIGLYEKLEELYAKHGYGLNVTKSYGFAGARGFAMMKKIMAELRGGLPVIGGEKTVSFTDYLEGIGDLPKSDVLCFGFADGSRVTVRPSGTEPKLKVYFDILSPRAEEAEQRLAAMSADMAAHIQG